MTPAEIQFCVVNTSIHTTWKPTGAYRPRRKSRLRWLQVALIWLARKAGAIEHQEAIHAQTFSFDPQKAADSVLPMVKEQLDHLWRGGYAPVWLIIGCDHFDRLGVELMASRHEAMAFDARFGFDRTIFGLKVVLVPWVSGVFAMSPPKVVAP